MPLEHASPPDAPDLLAPVCRVTCVLHSCPYQRFGHCSPGQHLGLHWVPGCKGVHGCRAVMLNPAPVTTGLPESGITEEFEGCYRETKVPAPLTLPCPSSMTVPGRSAVTCLGNRTKHPFSVEEIMGAPPPHPSSQRCFYRARSVIWLLGLLVPHPVVVERDDVGRQGRQGRCLGSLSALWGTSCWGKRMWWALSPPAWGDSSAPNTPLLPHPPIQDILALRAVGRMGLVPPQGAHLPLS